MGEEGFAQLVFMKDFWVVGEVEDVEGGGLAVGINGLSTVDEVEKPVVDDLLFARDGGQSEDVDFAGGGFDGAVFIDLAVVVIDPDVEGVIAFIHEEGSGGGLYTGRFPEAGEEVFLVSVSHDL